MCESVYISHLTFFSLGADSRRQWKCRVGATDRHAIALWPLSFTSRQTGRVKTGPSLIWTNAVSVRVTWAPGENAAWMTDISLLYASINHNLSKLSLLACVLLFLYFLHSKCIFKKISWEKMLPNRDLKEAEQQFQKTIKQGKEIRLPLAPEIAWWFWHVVQFAVFFFSWVTCAFPMIRFWQPQTLPCGHPHAVLHPMSIKTPLRVSHRPGQGPHLTDQ